MAHTIQPKKLLIVNIIDILNRYTDSEHTLTQREIEQILKDEYLMEADRKTVRRNLSDLIDCGIFELEYKETTRITPKMVKNAKTGKMEPTGEMEESSVYTDFSLVRDFTEGELRYLIDGVFASKHIAANHRRELIKKIERLGGRYFKAHANNIAKEAPTAVYSAQLFYTIGVLDEAIQKRKKVKFRYKGFGLDKKANYRLDENGSPKEYLINPYEMVSKNGQYYLICSDDKHDDLSNYRVDRIADIELFDERVRPLKDFASKAKMDSYVAEHIYMFAGESVSARFRIRRRMIADVVDTFGEGFRVSDVEPDEQNGWMTISATVNADSLAIYARSYAPDVIVLSPKSVVDRIKREMTEALAMYNEIA
ncbi:helix-turn-helix transcriptional regulator [Anaerotardibacter muris]|uniref:helix-turn-helix transcriptional regulator n=1 Tax=Anaerotardibacter muris TaxID=2941505 RepID=UPI00203B6700|nr:WYL domain-containing protein [Anaerotardibacter muris]